SGTPNGDEFTMFSLIYGGKLIGGTYDPDGTGPASTYNSIYAYFVNNGTYAGGVHSIVSHPPGQALKVPYVAIASGQIAAGILEDGSPKYEALVTGVSNVSTGTGILWQATLPGSSQISDTAAYGNTLAVANGATGYVETVATGSGSGSWPLQGSSGTGVSSYNGRYAFQGTGGVTAISQSGTAQLWSVAAPAQYGTTGLTNATPIQTPNNIYTIWPNRYVAEENQSSGAFTNYAAVPYPGTINPIMILAYGKLFASFGNKLVVFGTCQANSNSSILSTLATLYLNNEGSCADYLLYSLHGIGNSSMSLNSKPVITKAYLNGVPGSNIIIPYESQLGINGPFTVSLWFNSNKPSTTTFTSELFDTKTASQDTFDIALIGRGANPGIQIDAGAGGSSWLAQPFIPLAFQQNRWYNVVVTVGTTSTSVYLNGANVSTTSYSSAAPLLVADNLPIQLGSGGADPFYGSLSNVQIYSNTILQNQISQLYSAGLNGGPTSQSNIVDWFPLAGDANGYGPIMAPGFPSAVVYNDTVYNATGLVNSFSVSSQLVQAPLQNYSTGRYNLYNISVYSWR
ncbi:MAG: hypothetical protein KGH64_06400, partial [Candidatus Micrarchaeota archaeon]|nr:hypothetical protein [Candidatus Micrarchaeota archaeon]